MKKVMIALLAMAVLFGFAACDNSNDGPSTPAGENYVVELLVTGTPELLLNEKAEESDYKVQIRYYDGTIADAPADSIEFTFDATSKAEENTKVGSVKYTAYNYGETVTDAELKGNVYKIDALDVKGPEGYAELYQNATASGNVLTGTTTAATVDNLIDKEAYTVNAIYTVDGEVKVRELLADQYVVGFKASNSDTKIGTATVEFKPCLATPGTADSFTQSGSGYTNEATVRIIADELTSWDAVAKNVTIVQGQATTHTDIDTPEELVSITANYKSGVSASDSPASGNWTSGVTGTAFNSDATKATYAVTYNSETKNVSFDVVTPRVESFTVALSNASDVTESNVASADMELTVSDVTITPTWVNGVSVSGAFANGADFTVNGVSGADSVFATITKGSTEGKVFGPYNVVLTKYAEANPAIQVLTVTVGAGA